MATPDATLAAAEQRAPRQPVPLRHGRVWPWPSLAASAVLVLAAAVVSLVFWPGHMDPDTTDEYQQARTGAYTDWHTPILSALWRGAYLAGLHSIGWVLTAGVLTLLAGTYLVLRMRLSRPWATAGGVLVLVFPPVLGWAVQVGRDAWFVALLLAAFGLLARAARSTGRVRMVFLVAAVLFAALTAASRQNAFPALIVFFAAAVALAWPPTSRRHLLGVVLAGTLCTAVLLGVESGVSQAVLRARSLHIEQVVFDYDLAALSRQEGRVLFPRDIFTQDLAHIRRWSNTLQADELEFGPGEAVHVPLTGRSYETLRSAWVSAVREHPLDYLLVRLKLGLRMAAVTGPADPVFQDPPAAPGFLPRFPRLAQPATAYLFLFTENHNAFAGGPLHRPWLYLLALLAGSLWFLWRRARRLDWLLGLLCVALLLYAAVVLFTAPSAYYRFLYPDVVGGALVVILFAAEAVTAIGRRRLFRRAGEP
jgi:hypothetical protein